jgi:serine-type D-Ala-D-Ala carboxypeptidase/endopeptidase (penicillin-binding protein 4)
LHGSCSWLTSLLVAALLFLSSPVHGQSLIHRELARSLDAILDAEPFENAFWGALVIDANSGTVLYERFPDKSFVPASNVKLYSTAAALEVLGTTFTYQTQLVANGDVRDGVLSGDLVIRGSGDPSFGARFNDGDRLAVYRAWADSLRAAGIAAVHGNIVGDGRVFDDVPLGRGWSWDDEAYGYSAEVGGLSFNDNTVDFSLTARSPGQPAMLSWEPESTSYVTVQNYTTTVSRDSALTQRYSRARGTNYVRFETRIPVGRQVEPSVAITNSAAYAAHVFLEELRRQGFEITGHAHSVDRRTPYTYRSNHPVARYASPPLREVIDVVNKRSHNLYAEALLKTIGALAPVIDDGDVPGSTGAGLRRARHIWGAAGVDTARARLVDGSGLSRHNLVTPRMTAALLRHMWLHPDADVRDAFIGSLPVGGIDGTLQSRFRHGITRGQVRAKTGTLSGASALAGYTRSRRSGDLIFVLMANHFTSSSGPVRAAQDAFVERLVTW